MKRAKNKEELENLFEEIFNNTEDYVYFEHQTGTGLGGIYFLEGIGILTKQELKEKGIDPNEYFDEELNVLEIEDKNLQKKLGIDIDDDEIQKIEEEYYRECTESMFSKGLYAEQPDISSTATRLRTQPTQSFADALSYEGYSNRGSMHLILEIPKEYIYGKKRDKLFQDGDIFESSSGSHMGRFNKVLPSQFIKSAVIVERGMGKREYTIIDNENYRRQEIEEKIVGDKYWEEADTLAEQFLKNDDIEFEELLEIMDNIGDRDIQNLDRETVNTSFSDLISSLDNLETDEINTLSKGVSNLSEYPESKIEESGAKESDENIEIGTKENTQDENKDTQEQEISEAYINESGEIIRPGNDEKRQLPIAEGVSTSMFSMAKYGKQKSRDVVESQKELKTSYKESITPTMEIDDNKMMDEE